MEAVSAFFVGTIVPCLPALVALVAWGEAGSRHLRQFGARMLWELAGLVVVGVAILLYAMLGAVADDGSNIFVVIVGSLIAVLAVTTVTYRFPDKSTPARTLITAGIAVLSLEIGLALGVFVCLRVWPHGT